MISTTISAPGFRPLSEYTPVNTDNVGDISVGYVFTPTVNGWIIAFGRYGSGNTTVILWDNIGNELGRVTVSPDSGWRWAYLPSAIPVTAGNFYRVSVTCTADLYTESFSYPKIGGNINIISACYAYPEDAEYPFPVWGDSENMYGWADIEFVEE